MRLTSFLIAMLLSTMGYASSISSGGSGPSCSGVSDGLVYTASGGSCSFASVAGTGDVVGPGSSTDNGFARFDSTTGKLLQNTGTGATLGDTGIATFANVIDSGLTASTLVYSNGSKQITSLGAGTNGDVNVQASGIPSWTAQANIAAGTAAALASNPSDCGANLFATTIAANGNLTCANPFTGMVEDIHGYIPTAADATYPVTAKNRVARQVTKFAAKCGSGSITAKLQIGGSDITTCTAMSITTSVSDTTCNTGASNDLASGGRLTLVTSSNSSCTGFEWSIETTRD